MKILDLPRGVSELARKRIEETQMDFCPDDDVYYIVWDKTPEGFLFWRSIATGDFAPYYGCRFVNIREKRNEIVEE